MRLRARGTHKFFVLIYNYILIMVKRLLYFTYGLILVTYMASILLPLFGYSLNLDTISLGFAGLLLIFGFALVYFHDPTIIRRLKISPSGLEADFRELTKQVSEEDIQEVDESVRSDVQQIESSDTEPAGVFLTLVTEIESKIRLLAERRIGGSWGYRPVPVISRNLNEKGFIDNNTLSIILNFWGLRNQIIHGKFSLSQDNLDDAIMIGQIIMGRLTRKYISAIIISPIRGPTGSEITITGTGFSVGGYISIYYDEIQESNLIDRVRVEEDGTISQKLEIPNLTIGVHSISVIDETTELILQTSFEII